MTYAVRVCLTSAYGKMWQTALQASSPEEARWLLEMFVKTTIDQEEIEDVEVEFSILTMN